MVRADQIDDEGLITNQIIEHLLEDELVVADLSGLNPNVFYEIAVRHAARKPIVHLIANGEEIPFDIANMRAVPYELGDPDVLEEAQAELGRKVRAIEDGDFQAAQNPISAARDVWLLRDSEQPDVRHAGDVLSSLNELRDEVRSLSRRVGGGGASGRRLNSVRNDHVEEELARFQPVSVGGLAEILGVEDELVGFVLSKLADAEKAAQRPDGRWIALPADEGRDN